MKLLAKCFFATVLSLCVNTSARAEGNIMVHEWATFTCLLGEDGKAIGGINIEDLSVAETLHKIAPGSLLPVSAGGATSGEPTRGHSQVTMRLEKAVTNFYLPADRASPASANVEIKSYSGWLTQFVPEAKVESPGFSRDIGRWAFLQE